MARWRLHLRAGGAAAATRRGRRLTVPARPPPPCLYRSHLLWHELMGQAAVFVVEPSAVPPRPWGMPACSRTCTYNAAPWSVSTVNKQFGGSGFELPRAG